MQIVIDIPEEEYKNIMNDHGVSPYGMVFHSIQNGIPIPDNATILSVTEWADRCRECGKRYVKRQTGHWKRISMDRYTTHAQYWYECDKCGEHNLGNTNFCQNCGVRMVDQHESEEGGEQW